MNFKLQVVIQSPQFYEMFRFRMVNKDIITTIIEIIVKSYYFDSL